MKIIVAPCLLIKSTLERTNSLSLAGGTAPIQELCPNETLGMRTAAAPAPRWYVADLGVGATAPTPADIWDAAHEAAIEPGCLKSLVFVESCQQTYLG